MSNLAKENTNFSNNDNIGGSLTVDGTQWTIAAQVSMNMGIPLTLSFKDKKYDQDSKFLSGVRQLAKSLKKMGMLMNLFVVLMLILVVHLIFINNMEIIKLLIMIILKKMVKYLMIILFFGELKMPNYLNLLKKILRNWLVVISHLT